MRYSTAKLLFFLLFQLLSFHTFSKERLDFSFIGANEGLSENIVNDIVQDKKGFIWLATNDGLNRYDGYRMSHFRYDPSEGSTPRRGASTGQSRRPRQGQPKTTI